jgi:hypothetical protein
MIVVDPDFGSCKNKTVRVGKFFRVCISLVVSMMMYSYVPRISFRQTIEG